MPPSPASSAGSTQPLRLQELLAMFQEAAQINGYSLQEVIAAAAPEGIRTPTGLRTPPARKAESPEVSPIDGLEALFSDTEAEPKAPLDPPGGQDLPSPLPSPAATDGEEKESSEEDLGLEIPKLLDDLPPPLLLKAAAEQQAKDKKTADPPTTKEDKQPPRSAGAAPEPEVQPARKPQPELPPPKAEPEAAGSEPQESAEDKLQKLQVANSVTHPREYRQFLRVIQQRHLPDGVDAALKAKGKQTLFQEFLAADCNITSVAATMKKEVEKACRGAALRQADASRTAARR
jgi:hypothetical protein